MFVGYGQPFRARQSVRWLLTPVAVLAGSLALAPVSAQAGQGNSTTPTFPIVAKVGDVGLDASIEILNASTPPQSIGPSTICNFGDGGQCAGDAGITLVPSCGQINPAGTACIGPDPGVFAVTSVPVGAAGSGCDGIPFVVTVADAALGTLRFTPQNSQHISLTSGATCKILFKINVLKTPTMDIDPGTIGSQTKQLASSRLVSQVQATLGQGTGTSFGTTVKPPPPGAPPPPAPCVLPPGPVPPEGHLCTPAPPCVPPPGPAPPGVKICTPPPCVRPPGPASPGAKICTTAGTARITGRSGCVTQNFNVTVTGQRIRSVTFALDGKRIKVLHKPNVRGAYRIVVRPGLLRRGTHRITARTMFTTESATRDRTLQVVFQRCARRQHAPNFTG
jgi:hypothetical protein